MITRLDMFEHLVELINGYFLEVIAIILAGILVGELVSQIYWSGRINKKNSTLKELKTSLKEKNTELEELRTSSKELLTKQQAEINNLSTQLSENVDNSSEWQNKVNVLNTNLKNYELLLKEREKRVGILNSQLDYRDENLRNLNQQMIEKDESIEELKNKSISIEKTLKAEIENRDEKIRNLQRQSEKDSEAITSIEKELAELENRNHEYISQAEKTEANIVGLEKSLYEKNQTITSLKERISKMQDDFTHIVGIGPKVSSVLRSAGINSFSKLSSTNVNRLKEIIEKENPNLLRLTNPSMWPEQAKLASEEKWDALTVLQESLKEANKQKNKA